MLSFLSLSGEEFEVGCTTVLFYLQHMHLNYFVWTLKGNVVGYVFPCIKRNKRSKKIVTLSQSLKFKFLILANRTSPTQ